ncbi:hypothetical protein [Nocardioides sp. TF02-7]|uniref:hypothetical protein n=1 Tax=Nocardioides sp. TF02-7 TaxID=2917724 RepID=UPI001F069548|nr:hypothetical protein [Nocardioides sp. TF02-7]UMG93053.1 hypothetical protein MF408_01530 [Nocardioides sp. TF02-7]
MPVQPAVRPDVVLHIGTAKTGTSTLQRFLSRNRTRLAADGLLYPRSPGRTRHADLGMFIRSDEEVELTLAWHRSGRTSVPDFRRRFRRRLFREIDEWSPSRVVFSDEGLYGAPKPAVERLRRFTERFGGSRSVVVYLRRQDDHLVSRYQQEVKVGETRRLTDWVVVDWSDFYDYRRRLERFRRILEPTSFVVRRFERDRFLGGDLVEDFMDAAAVTTPLAELERTPSRNESMSAEAVELLRLLNIHRREADHLRRVEIDNRPYVERLLDAAPGPALTLPDDVLDAFMAQWEETNRAVARDLLGDPSGELFSAPRRSRDVTTDQRLDPARVDHYVELLELPEELREPLRELARRGA